MTKPVTCSLLTPGVEVVTERTEDGAHVTTINGGRLDGERFVCGPDRADSQHQRACQLVRLRKTLPV